MNIFFVGICGTGMSNLAVVLHLFGHAVAGSDFSTDFYTAGDLKQHNIPIYAGSDAARITRTVDMLIYSAAYATFGADSPESKHSDDKHSDDKHSASVQTENPEIRRALSLGIPVLSYPQMAARLSRQCTTICIAGTHGKTSTSMILAAMLHELQIPAAVLAGTSIDHHQLLGKYRCSLQQNTYAKTADSDGPVLILESCEYRRHFLLYDPDILVLTAVDYDHVDYYPTEEEYIAAFTERIDTTDPSVPVIWSPDDKGSREAVRVSSRKCGFITYGRSSYSRHNSRLDNSVKLDEPLDYSIAHSNTGNTREPDSFLVNGEKIVLAVPGEAMEFDAAAAYVACLTLAEQRSIQNDKAVQAAVRGAESYQGARRRFDCIGSASGILFYDDYAHHPAEITAVLQSFRLKYPEKRIIVDFIPHTISRTKQFLSQFASALESGADAVCIQEIYPSVREKHAEGSFSARFLAEMIPRSRFFADLQSAEEFLAAYLRSGDLFITLGAGDNRTISEHLYARFSETDRQRSSGKYDREKYDSGQGDHHI